MMIFLAIIAGILILLFLITLHEFGHFIMAKIFKVYVYEFAIGIGPKIFSWSGKETKYSIRIFPFGGYVYTASEFLDPPKEKKDIEIPKKRFIEGINRFKRLLIIFSGALMNFNIAIILFTLIFAITKCSPNDLDGYGAKYYTEPNSPAYILGLQNNNIKDPEVITDISFFYVSDTNKEGKVSRDDYLHEVNDKTNQHIINSPTKINNFYQTSLILQKYLSVDKKNHSSNTLFIKFATYNHKTHKLYNFTDWSKQGYKYGANSKYIINKKYIIGMTSPDLYFKNSYEGYLYGWKKMSQESVSILRAFGHLFTGQWSQISGPIGTIKQTENFINSGPESFFLYVAVLSANLFILNLIPVPPLDGFKFLIVFVEMCIRRELNDRAKLFVTIIGASLFFILFIGLTLKDIFF